MRVCLTVLLTFVPGLATSAQAQRTTTGLQVLYTFDEGDGRIVHDQSGTGTPLDLTIADPGKTKWSRSVLTLNNETVLKSDGPARKVIDAVRTSRAISVEAWVRPANTKQSGPARILSLSTDTGNRNVTLGQQQDAWEVRLRTTATSTNGIPATTTGGGSLKSVLTHIVYTRDSDGTATVFVDGKPIATQKTEGDLSNWDESYPLLIANEATADRAWLGDLHLIAVYSRALTVGEVQQNFAAGTGDFDELVELIPPAAERQVNFVSDVQPILPSALF
ncbi:MAG: LamG domain-containing protein [Planctomycetaceae bacterium]